MNCLRHRTARKVATIAGQPIQQIAGATGWRPNGALEAFCRGARPRQILQAVGFLLGIAFAGQLVAQSPDRAEERKQRLLKHAESLIAGTLPSPQQLRPQSVLPERPKPPQEDTPLFRPPIRRVQLAAHPRPPAEATQQRKQQLLSHAETLIAGKLPSQRDLRSQQAHAESPPPSPVTPSTQPTPQRTQPPIRRIPLAAHPSPQPELPFGQAPALAVVAGPQPMLEVPATPRSTPAASQSAQPSPQKNKPIPGHLAGYPGLIQEQSPPLPVEPPQASAPVREVEKPAELSVVESGALPSQEPEALPAETPPALESVDGPEAMPWFGPGPAYASRPSLDIRPRYLEEDEEGLVPVGLVPAEELPADTSGLPTVPTQGQVLTSYAIDIRPVDICASARFAHKPLYYEDKYLERFGSAPGVLRHADCARSGVHFLWSTATIPLHFWHVRPWECVSTDCLVRTQSCCH